MLLYRVTVSSLGDYMKKTHTDFYKAYNRYKHTSAYKPTKSYTESLAVLKTN